MAKDQPADPGRRQFFRRIGQDTAISAGRAVGAAESLRRGGTALATEILGYGLGDPARSATRLEERMERPPASSFASAYRYTGDALVLLDQRALPERRDEVACREASEVAAAFRAGVAGGPILGEIAAYALVLTAHMAEDRP